MALSENDRNNLSGASPKAGMMFTDPKMKAVTVDMLADKNATKACEPADAAGKAEMAVVAPTPAISFSDPKAAAGGFATKPAVPEISAPKSSKAAEAAPTEHSPIAKPSPLGASTPLVVKAPIDAAEEKTEAFDAVEADAPTPFPGEAQADAKLPDASELVVAAPASENAADMPDHATAPAFEGILPDAGNLVTKAPATTVSEDEHQSAPEAPAYDTPITADMVMPKPAAATEPAQTSTAPQPNEPAFGKEEQEHFEIPVPVSEDAAHADETAEAVDINVSEDAQQTPDGVETAEVVLEKPKKKGKKALIGVGIAVFLAAAIGIGVTAGTLAAQQDNEAKNIESSEVQRTAPTQGTSDAQGASEVTLPAAADAENNGAVDDSTAAIQAACEHDWQPYEVSEQTSDGTTQEIEIPAEYENVIEYHTLCNTCHEKCDGSELAHTLATGHTAFTKDVATKETIEKTPAHTETVQASAGQTIRTWSKEQCTKCNLIRDIDTKTEVVDAQ